MKTGRSSVSARVFEIEWVRHGRNELVAVLRVALERNPRLGPGWLKMPVTEPGMPCHHSLIESPQVLKKPPGLATTPQLYGSLPPAMTAGPGGTYVGGGGGTGGGPAERANDGGLIGRIGRLRVLAFVSIRRGGEGNEWPIMRRRTAVSPAPAATATPAPGLQSPTGPEPDRPSLLRNRASMSPSRLEHPCSRRHAAQIPLVRFRPYNPFASSPRPGWPDEQRS